MIFVLMLVLNFSNFIYCEKILLKDGTVIYGDFEGEMDNYMIIRTKYGVLSVPKLDILDNGNVVNIPDDVKLRIVIDKSSDVYIRRFYDGDVLKATQVLSKDGILISSEGYIRDGIYYEYDDNQNIISERIIKNGIENGPLTEFYHNGGVKARIDYNNGKIHGKAIFYTMDSKPMLEQSYSNGVLDGFSIEYDIDGNVKTKILYSSGKLVDNIVKTDIKEGESVIISSVAVEKEISNVNIKTDITSRIVNIARGKKVFVYIKNKYWGSFSYDNDYNVIDITGKLPDGVFDVDVDNKKLRFEFISNWPVSMDLIENGVIFKKFVYDENGKAIEKK